MLIFKVLFLQLFWLSIVLYGSSLNSILLIGAAICVGIINYTTYKPTISTGRFFLSLFYSLPSDTYMTYH